MGKVAIEALKAYISSDESKEYKFLITSDGRVYISEEPVDNLTTLTHEAWFYELQRRGVIDASQTVETTKGGYIKKVDGKMYHWGDSTTPIKGTTEQSLFGYIKENGVLLVSARRRDSEKI